MAGSVDHASGRHGAAGCCRPTDDGIDEYRSRRSGDLAGLGDLGEVLKAEARRD